MAVRYRVITMYNMQAILHILELFQCKSSMLCIKFHKSHVSLEISSMLYNNITYLYVAFSVCFFCLSLFTAEVRSTSPRLLESCKPAYAFNGHITVVHVIYILIR